MMIRETVGYRSKNGRVHASKKEAVQMDISEVISHLSGVDNPSGFAIFLVNNRDWLMKLLKEVDE